jgi:hypothetical protein
VHHHLKTDRGVRARMKAIRIHEHGGVGTLKLESQTTKCWFESTMPVPGCLEVPGKARVEVSE